MHWQAVTNIKGEISLSATFLEQLLYTLSYTSGIRHFLIYRIVVLISRRLALRFTHKSILDTVKDSME